MAGNRVRSPVGAAAVAAVLAALVAALVLSVVGGDDPAAPPPLTLDPDATGTVPVVDRAGEPAPTFAFPLLADPEGDEVDFDAFRAGRPAVVNFFFRDCPPCVAEMPALEAAHRRLGEDVAFLGLSYQESVANGREIVDRTGVTYEVGRDPSGDLIIEFGGVGLPTTVFIRADGTISAVHTGDVRAELDDELAELVA